MPPWNEQYKNKEKLPIKWHNGVSINEAMESLELYPYLTHHLIY